MAIVPRANLVYMVRESADGPRNPRRPNPPRICHRYGCGGVYKDGCFIYQEFDNLQRDSPVGVVVGTPNATRCGCEQSESLAELPSY